MSVKVSGAVRPMQDALNSAVHSPRTAVRIALNVMAPSLKSARLIMWFVPIVVYNYREFSRKYRSIKFGFPWLGMRMRAI